MSEGISWSIMRYDLKTGLDVQSLPCLVKVADGSFGFQSELGVGDLTYGCKVKFEKHVCVCYVRARVIELPDSHWFIKKKGEEFVQSHALLAGSEVLLPLEYPGTVRQYDRNGGKQYFTIRELVDDFPRFVRVEKDVICASPGVSAPQIVRTGTILRLDRVTKSVQTVRGSRETYLICHDDENSRELAFRIMTPVHFSKLPDKTKNSLKDLVETLPLPQTVEFYNTNPYDVISIDDEDAQDLLVMMSAPLQLLYIQSEHFIVGKVDERSGNECDGEIIAIPAKDYVLENIFIHLPVDINTRHVACRSHTGNYVDLTVSDDRLYDCLQQMLYLRYAEEETPLVLRIQSDTPNYKVEDMPDTPPVPDKNGRGLKHSASDTIFNPGKDDTKQERRKRFFSSNDADKKSSNHGTETTTSGFRSYMTRFTRRMKSTAQILFGMDALSATADSAAKDSQTSRGAFNSDSKPGFTCYLNNQSDEVSKKLSDDDVFEPSNGCDRVLALTDTSGDRTNVVYASIDVLKKNSAMENPCTVCREINHTLRLQVHGVS